MAQWYVKDLSKLTGVSVQTLHHYDRIDLLKPSVRLPNGYRVYSEKDLLSLQQIIALKFFGFELSQIKELLSGNAEALEHFSVQAKLLEQKANMLLDASNALKQIISLKLGKIRRRLEENHKIELSWDSEFLDEVASRCTEVESGARNVDNILTNTLLPDLSRRLLNAVAEGSKSSAIRIGIGENGSFVYTQA